jgi:hypothetical protein
MTPLNFRAICSAEDWERIAGVKHPTMRGRIHEVAKTLSDPDEIRRSQPESEVILFHRRSGIRWICAVVRQGRPAARLITAYPADKVKQGDLLWRK